MRCILRTAIVFRPIISSAVLCLVQVTLLGACTSTKQPLGASDQQPAATVVNALATSPALDTPPPAPEGVDGELWARLVAELERVLAEEGTARRTAAVPTGQASAVCDLGSYTASGSTYYTWSYRNQGDYDLNGEVNIADLTMIGLHFGKNTLSDDWQQAQLADGDSNMEVNIADVTPIGTNFGGRIDGYELQKSPDGTQPYTMMADYGFTPGDVTTGIYPPFEHIGPLVIFGPTFRVVPYVDDGGQRAYGIASYVVGSGNNNLGDRWHTSRANNFRDGLAMVEGPAGIGGTWSVDLEGFSELNLFAEPVVDQTGMIYLGTTSQSVLTEMLPGHFYAVSPQGDLEWDYSTISGVGMAAATNRRGRIVIGDISGMVYCLASDGKQYWRQQLAGGLVFGGPLLDDAGTVFILSHTLSISGITSSTLYKLTPDGEIDWSRALDRPCQGAPVFSPDGHVTVVDELGEVYSFDFTGTSTHNYTMPDAFASGIYTDTPMVYTDMIGYATDNETIRFHTYDNTNSYFVAMQGERPVSMPVVNSQGRIVFVSVTTMDPIVTRLNYYQGGVQDWDIDLPGNFVTNLAIDKSDRMYVGTFLYSQVPTVANGIHCVLPDQTVSWFHPAGLGWIFSVIVASEDLVVYASISLEGSETVTRLTGIYE